MPTDIGRRSSSSSWVEDSKTRQPIGMDIDGDMLMANNVGPWIDRQYARALVMESLAVGKRPDYAKVTAEGAKLRKTTLDALKANAVCCRTAQSSGGIVAPPDYWHIHEIGLYAAWAAEWAGEARPWLTAVPPWIHFKNVCYHLRAADALGFHAAILLTGHYGPNWEDLKTLIEILQPQFAIRMFGLPDF